ncbi:hypothetical protein FVR03_08655 [Pontibacter qinzhouensis]|uniref:GMT-like wHTH domain-containing protein n=1 Tax=Pontibacter qinzhouensis TaxID=2603253 RepID=A0A5C8KAC5_9BACT|nr:hypothetical protein [Pontibacter qinzhouensis]TXK47928.1 hypothetical protein FVR03_08655 [Pontibacter qinzhouensis]
MAAPAPQEFFRVQRSISEIKTEMLSQFFQVWYRLQTQPGALLYADLLAGQAGAEEETLLQHELSYLPQALLKDPQKPLLVFCGAPAKPDRKAKQQQESQAAEVPITQAPLLLQQPENQLLLTEQLAQLRQALVVADPFATPFGQELLLQCTQLQHPDLLLLLDPKKLRATVSGKKTTEATEQLFGESLNSIRSFCKRERNAQNQEAFIVAGLEKMLQTKGFQTLHFRADAPAKDQTTCYLLFATASLPVYRAFKEKLLPYSEIQADRVPVFGANLKQLQQLALFPEQLRYSVQKLAEDLVGKASQYNYKSIEKIAEDHHPGTHYIKDNYRQAFELLRDQGLIEMLNPKTLQTIRKATMASPVKFKQKP